MAVGQTLLILRCIAAGPRLPWQHRAAAHLAEVTRMVLVHVNPVVVLTTGVTATSWMLTVLANAAMAGADVPALLPVLLEACAPREGAAAQDTECQARCRLATPETRRQLNGSWVNCLPRSDTTVSSWAERRCAERERHGRPKTMQFSHSTKCPRTTTPVPAKAYSLVVIFVTPADHAREGEPGPRPGTMYTAPSLCLLCGVQGGRMDLIIGGWITS